MNTNQVLVHLADFKKSLQSLMDPKILSKLSSLLEAFGPEQKSWIEQFEFWVEKNGEDCRYATMAKEIFLKENAKNVAREIIWLYKNWAKTYE